MNGYVKIGFSSIFWITSHTNGQTPNNLGILCNPTHLAFNSVPTVYFTNWQSLDGMANSNSNQLDATSKNLTPIVEVIDDLYTANNLGLIFKAKINESRLLVSGIDLLNCKKKQNRSKTTLT